MEKKELNSFLGHKIVIHDSGVGGKSIFEKTQKLSKNLFYFADSDNFPYGTKTFEELKLIFLKNLEKLQLKKGDLLVLACNTISCIYSQLKKDLKIDYKILSVLDFVIAGKEGVIICTQYTSKYLDKLGLLNKPLKELASLIENDMEVEFIEDYLKSNYIKENKIIYGCTHYPIIDKIFKRIYFDKEFVNPEDELVKNIKLWIDAMQIKEKLIYGN